MSCCCHFVSTSESSKAIKLTNTTYGRLRQFADEWQSIEKEPEKSLSIRLLAELQKDTSVIHKTCYARITIIPISYRWQKKHLKRQLYIFMYSCTTVNDIKSRGLLAQFMQDKKFVKFGMVLHLHSYNNIYIHLKNLNYICSKH